MAKMKKCKTCGAEIAKSAKTCPHCGAKKGPGVIRIIVGVFLLFIGIGMIASIGADENNNEQLVYGINETANYENISVTLKSVEESTGSYYLEPADGNIFLICEFEIENNSNSELAISSMLSFEAYIDDYAAQIDLSALTSSDLPQLDGKVAPGKKMHGIVGYQASEEWETIEIQFLADVWANSTIKFSATNN